MVSYIETLPASIRRSQDAVLDSIADGTFRPDTRTGLIYRFAASAGRLSPASDHPIAPTAGAWGPGRRVSPYWCLELLGL